jgi:cytochrome c-type biogenesis protein
MELTLAAAFLAGLVSFLSPCVLPVVPAYLGQIGALAATARPAAATGLRLATAGGGTIDAVAPPGTRSGPRRAAVLPAALAFVAGFGAIFTLFGLTVYVGGSLLGLSIPVLRQVGGVLLVLLGLNLAGVLRIGLLARSWRPLEPRISLRRDRSAVASSPVGALGLGAIFAIGWTPCVGPTLGAIFGLASFGPSPQAVLLFAAYSLGLGVPFIGAAMALDRAPALIRPLVRHGRLVEVVGGLLVALIGVAMLFDWLSRIAALFSFLTPRV